MGQSSSELAKAFTNAIIPRIKSEDEKNTALALVIMSMRTIKFQEKCLKFVNDNPEAGLQEIGDYIFSFFQPAIIVKTDDKPEDQSAIIDKPDDKPEDQPE